MSENTLHKTGVVWRKPIIPEMKAPVMSGMFTYLVPVAIGAVTIVLFLGLFNMLRAGSPSTSQNLMRWRVGLQAVAVAVLLCAIWYKSR